MFGFNVRCSSRECGEYYCVSIRSYVVAKYMVFVLSLLLLFRKEQFLLTTSFKFLINYKYNTNKLVYSSIF